MAFIKVNLFESLVPEDKRHKNYVSILGSIQQADRNELQRWAKGFPDRDNKFVKEFQTTFNSGFWEVYLYALFNEMGIKMDWSHSTPDFIIEIEGKKIVIEATIAAAAMGKTPEWEKKIEAVPTRFKKMNIESIIRLSNSITSKYKKYKDEYCKLEHVKSNPFVIAVAPFEQPYFNQQYDTPIMALLYDYYVDEDAYNDNPYLYPNGPPGISMGSVKKENGAEIVLGFFEDDSFSDISVILLSTTATWGKVEAMSKNNSITRYINTLWWSNTDGDPVFRPLTKQNHKEKIRDGLLVFHNPYAKHPINANIFKVDGVVQVFSDPNTKKITKQTNGDCLMHRQSINFIAKS